MPWPLRNSRRIGLKRLSGGKPCTENLTLFVRFLRSKRPAGALPATLLTRPLLEDVYVWLMRPETSHIARARSKDTARKVVEVIQLM